MIFKETPDRCTIQAVKISTALLQAHPAAHTAICPLMTIVP